MTDLVAIVAALTVGLAVFLGIAAWGSTWHGDPYDPCQFPDLCRREDE